MHTEMLYVHSVATRHLVVHIMCNCKVHSVCGLRDCNKLHIFALYKILVFVV